MSVMVFVVESVFLSQLSVNFQSLVKVDVCKLLDDSLDAPSSSVRTCICWYTALFSISCFALFLRSFTSLIAPENWLKIAFSVITFLRFSLEYAFTSSELALLTSDRALFRQFLYISHIFLISSCMFH